MNARQIIYLDNNATTQIDSRVLEEMMPFLTHNYANANSTHQFGIGAHEAIKVARKQASELIGAEPHEIVFTSGATEAINLAIKGVADNYKAKGKHIVTVATEHSAVLDTCRHLETKGLEVTFLPVRPNGLVDLDGLRAAVRRDTILVSVMMANNETGVLQPIKQIADIAHSVEAVFFSDCTQAAGKLSIDVDSLGIDLLCFSGHKLYAPKGIGLLFVRQDPIRIKVLPLLHGGGHERGLRSGTLNVPGIVALGRACEIARKEMGKNAAQILGLRNYLEVELLKIKDTSLNGDPIERLYNTTNVLFHGVDSDAVIMGLSNPESTLPLIAVSNGSACTSTRIEPSHVLTAMGLDETSAFSSIRFSIGKNNIKAELEIVIKAVKSIVEELRSLVC